MSLPEILTLVPGAPGLTILLWVFILSVGLYLARTPAHFTIASFSRMLSNGFRLAARAVMRAEAKLVERNREVLLAAGEEAAERMVEREFERINHSVERDLSEYPALQRKLGEEMARIDEDYHSSAEVPPAPSQWLQAIDAVAKIPAASDSAIATVLEDISHSMERSQREALEEYRSANRKRHQLLKRILPYWRAISRNLAAMTKNVESILERSRGIDRHMEHYESIIRKSRKAERILSGSASTQFFISGLVLFIATIGGVINFQLIARPLQEMVGGNTQLAGFRVADVAALVIISVEVAMGLFVMESLRITRLFPVIGALEDKTRIRMVIVSFTLLLFMACIESGLAYMREGLAQDDAALVASLTGEQTDTAENPNLWITTASQMGLGLILPFALTFVAIPLESFVHSSRVVFGRLHASLYRVVAFVLRLMANFFRYGGHMLGHFYDLLIFGPLWIERLVTQRKPGAAMKTNKDAAMGGVSR